MISRCDAINELISTDMARIDDGVALMVIPKVVGEEFKNMLRNAVYNTLLAASKESEGWVNRCDDAKRIPQVIHEMATEIKKGKS